MASRWARAVVLGAWMTTVPARAQDAEPASDDTAASDDGAASEITAVDDPFASGPMAPPPAIDEPTGVADPVLPPDRAARIEAPPVAPEPEEQPVRIEVAPGRGFTLDAGDAFSTTLRARVQLRDTIAIDGDEVTNAFELRALRIWWTGHVLSRDVKYGIQLALAPSEFEPNNPSPIFDAFVEFTHFRDLQLRVGQYFVPFDRARTIRESSLQTADRSQVVRELTLDRDIGLTLGSDDLFGLGWLGYRASLFGGDGRNRVGGRELGFLYVGRVFVRPLGAFDDDREGDTQRRPEPRLAIGLAGAVNHNTDRPRATTGTPYENATFDTYHLAADAVFKMHGVYFLGEVVWRGADRAYREFEADDGATMREWSRSAIGYLLQLGVMVHPLIELWARWDHMEALGETDPQLESFLDRLRHEIAAGANLYVNDHNFKVQLEWAHSFASAFDEGTHSVRLQLDASF